MSQTKLVRNPGWADRSNPTESISEAMAELSAASFTHALLATGAHGEVIDGRIAFESDTQDEVTATIVRLTHRRVAALMSVNHATARDTCERFFLDSAPLTGPVRGGV
jgi:hypothetical protein